MTASQVPPCRAEPELFWPPEGERAIDRVDREQAAKAICRACPLLDACRERALAGREYEIAGGGI